MVEHLWNNAIMSEQNTKIILGVGTGGSNQVFLLSHAVAAAVTRRVPGGTQVPDIPIEADLSIKGLKHQCPVGER